MYDAVTPDPKWATLLLDELTHYTQLYPRVLELAESMSRCEYCDQGVGRGDALLRHKRGPCKFIPEEEKNRLKAERTATNLSRTGKAKDVGNEAEVVEPPKNKKRKRNAEAGPSRQAPKSKKRRQEDDDASYESDS